MENNNVNRNNNSMNIAKVLSPAAIETIKDELVAECSYAGMIKDKNALREQLFQEYIEGIKTLIIPADPTDAISAEPNSTGLAEFSYTDDTINVLTRQDNASKVRTRRRNAYMAKKAISRKAQIASRSKRSRWLHDRSNHRAYVVMMGSKVIEAGEKGSKTERMWRLNKKAEKVGMVG